MGWLAPSARHGSGDRQIRAGRLRRRELRELRRQVAFLSPRRQVSRRDRRAGRQARRVRNQVHLRRLPVTAISDRIPRRAPAGALDRLGQPAEGQGRPALVHLYPSEKIGHDDVLHWTKLNQNWNFMCAECHSTGVRKNYDAARNAFATTWAEISVGCETCHGQGSAMSPGRRQIPAGAATASPATRKA